MIITGEATPSATRPGHLTTVFNCMAMESIMVDLFYDDAFLYVLPGETLVFDVPADWDLKQGEEIALSRLAPLESGQKDQTHLVWTYAELPHPVNFRP